MLHALSVNGGFKYCKYPHTLHFPLSPQLARLYNLQVLQVQTPSYPLFSFHLSPSSSFSPFSSLLLPNTSPDYSVVPFPLFLFSQFICVPFLIQELHGITPHTPPSHSTLLCSPRTDCSLMLALRCFTAILFFIRLQLFLLGRERERERERECVVQC